MRARPAGGSRPPLRILALALLAASCVETATPAGPVFPLVPADASLAVVIRNPAAFWNGVSAFWKAAGITGVAGADPEALIGQLIPDSGEAAKYFDPVRPLVLALLPKPPSATAESGDASPELALWVPVRGQPEAWLQKLGAGGNLRYRKTAKSYALFSSGERQPEFPAAKTLDLAPLERYPASAITLIAGPSIADSLPDSSWEGWRRDARRFVGSATAEDRSLEALALLGRGLLAEVGAAHAAILPSASGITIRLGATARQGGEFERLLRAAPAAAASGSALDMASHARADSLYAGAWAIDPAIGKAMLPAMNKLMDSLLLAVPESEAAPLRELWRVSRDLQEGWNGFAGSRGAYSIDMDFDVAAFAELGSAATEGDGSAALPDLARGIEDAMRINAEYLVDVRDEAKARAWFRALADEGKLASAFSAGAASSGLALSIRNEGKREGAFSYDELSLVFDPGEDSFENDTASPEVRDFLTSLSRLLSLRWTTAGGRLLMTTGDATALRDLSTRRAAPKPLSGESSFLAFRKAIPAKPFMVGSFSTRRVASLIADNLPAGTVTGLDPAAFSTWYGYAAFDAPIAATSSAPSSQRPAAAPAGLEFGFSIPASDIAAGLALFSSLKEAGEGGGI